MDRPKSKKNIAETRVFLTRDIPGPAVSMLQSAGFQVDLWTEDRPIPKEILVAQAGSCQALISLSTDTLDRFFLEACPRLEIISQFAAGYDNIDIPTATRLGIAVGNTPDAMSAATADVAFGLMIAVSRKMFFMHKGIAKGNWDYFRPKAHLGMELTGKTLGIFGLGRIGIQMAKRCKGAFDMQIIYHNRNRNRLAEESLGARRVDFDELLEKSDVLSVHSVLSKDTTGLFNRKTFARMKRNAIFINTSRGGAHVEADLLEALQNGTIWGAGLDVTNPEPMRPDNSLLSLENVAVLPHIGSATIEARNEMSRQAAQNIISYYTENRIPNLVNPEVFPSTETF